MSIKGIDHLYLETRHYRQSQEFWGELGFEIKAQWGDDGHRACQLEAGDGARLVLAEALDDPVGPTVHLSATNTVALNARLLASEFVEVSTPLEPTHWGTKWIRVTDPDGHTYALEEVT